MTKVSAEKIDITLIKQFKFLIILIKQIKFLSNTAILVSLQTY